MITRDPVTASAVSAAAPAPFFILGCPRSGTTLVAQLLDSHSRLAVLVETLYYPLFRHDLRCYGDLRRPANQRRLIENLLRMTRLHRLYRVEPPAADEILEALTTPTFAGVLATFLHLYARRQGKARGGEKSALHHRYLGEIQRHLTESPIFFVVRDPRDTVVSIRKMFDARLETAIWWWNQAYESYRRAPAPVQLVRYEELVADPSATLEGLCAALGERFEPGMLEFFRRVPERLRSARHHPNLAAPVNLTSVGSRRELTDADLALVETACGEGMAALAYAPTQPRAPGPTGRVRGTPGRLRGLGDRLIRFARRPDLLVQGWHRWRMRAWVRARWVLTLGPLRGG